MCFKDATRISLGYLGISSVILVCSNNALHICFLDLLDIRNCAPFCIFRVMRHNFVLHTTKYIISLLWYLFWIPSFLFLFWWNRSYCKNEQLKRPLPKSLGPICTHKEASVQLRPVCIQKGPFVPIRLNWYQWGPIIYIRVYWYP